MKSPLFIFLLGAAVGAGGLALFQGFGGAGSAPGEGGDFAVRPAPSVAVLEESLARSRAEVDDLRARLARTGGDPSGAPDAAAAVPGTPESKPEGGASESFVDLMLEMGRQGARQELTQRVTDLAERLGLSDVQADRVRILLEDRQQSKLEAAKRIMTGKASVRDLAMADDDHFGDFDRAMSALLTPDQEAAFADYREEREFERIKKKTTEDLQGLKGVVDLTPEQEEQVWEVFAAAHAESPPGAVPEDLTFEDFTGFVDGEISKRVDGLQPILQPEQLEAYRRQTETFRETVLKMVGHATGATQVQGAD